jgi:hypothetical protein
MIMMHLYKYVPFPEEIWTKNIEMSMGEFRLLGYLLKFRSSQPIEISDDELLHGRKDKRKRIDQGCGLSLNCMKLARARLIKKGIIAMKEHTSNRHRIYSLMPPR